MKQKELASDERERERERERELKDQSGWLVGLGWVELQTSRLADRTGEYAAEGRASRSDTSDAIATLQAPPSVASTAPRGCYLAHPSSGAC